MEEVEIKYEFDKFARLHCRACLSVGRNLMPLGKYADIYKKVTSDCDHQDPGCTQQLQMCWECLALLKKMAAFQLKVQKANEMLQLGQSYMYGTLSNLTIVVLNDIHPHTIYVNDQTNLQTDVSKVEIFTDTVDLNKTVDNLELSDDNCFTENDETLVQGQTVLETNVIKTELKSDIELTENIEHPSRRKTNNRWAKKRALQNKKPKFKIVITKDLIGEMIRRVQINPQDLHTCLQSERDSEYYKLKRYHCEECVLGFNTESSLLKHNKSWHRKNLGRYTCDICQKRAASKSALSTHIKEHYYKFECTLCEFSCRDKRPARRHAREHTKVFQCLKCALKFGSRREFFKHFKEWHERFICDYCGISFKMRYCLKDHIRKQHSPFECKPCEKRFARYNGLWLHNKTRHPPAAPAPPPAPAYCVECDRRYADVYRYRWHLANSARHTPRKRVRIPCPGCDKVFSKNIYMKDHYNLVHLKCYNYRCHECDKNFIRNADLVKHRRRVHEGILPPKNKICYMCGRGFSTNKILSNHVRTHTGERPHACAACPARFAQRAALRGHQRALHHDQPQ